MPLKSNSFSSSRSSVIKIHLAVEGYGTSSGLATHSLEALGIVPVRSLTKGKFGSLTSLKLKSKYSQFPVSSQPVVIRGVIPGTPAAQTQRLKPGEYNSDLVCNLHSLTGLSLLFL